MVNKSMNTVAIVFLQYFFKPCSNEDISKMYCQSFLSLCKFCLQNDQKTQATPKSPSKR